METQGSAHITTSEALTDGVRVAVRAQYSPQHSDPSRNEWFFLYTIEISNQGDETVQLIDRHWIIADIEGHTEEVHGPGVVGHQPVLEPGQAFEYTSGCPLTSPCGSMMGTYGMQRSDGSSFEARIARFELREPSALH